MNAAYSELTGILRRVNLIESVGGLLGWDEQVNLPPASAEHRAAQMAVMAELQHAAASDRRIGELLRELEGGNTTETVVLRQARKDYDRLTRLPAEFVREKALLSSRAYHAWAAARAGDDFAGYAPFIEQHLALAKREAAYLGYAANPYDYFIDLNDPGMTAASVGELFAGLKAALVPLSRSILGSKVKPPAGIFHGFGIEGQRKLLRAVTERLGFDYQRGRLDVSLHPFCSGSGADTRMTTRFNADEPLDALFSSIHETGHGLYEQGLPADQAGNALGMHAGMGVHESQSRLWENQVARSRAFWRHLEPEFRALFPGQTAGIGSDELYLAVNAVAPTLIRVDADEVTYNLHIILRFELEKKLLSGELKVADLPAAWRAASRDLIGMEPSNDREGVLQDVHWSFGGFGYFPSYCLGNMLAAQLWFAAKAALPGLESDFEKGQFGRLLEWLRKNVHAKGRQLSLLELAKEVTGEELSHKALIRYLRERYGALYLEQ